jgi:sialate O-acetylesterase
MSRMVQRGDIAVAGVPLSRVLLLLLAQCQQLNAAAPSFNLSATLTSHMVLQRAPARVIVWGWGQPGTSLQLHTAGAPITTAVDAAGQWRMVLAPQPAGAAFGSGKLTFTSDATRTVLTDVSFGEVWMCTGQSNMGISLSGVCTGPSGDCTPGHTLVSLDGSVSDGPAEIANASAYPLLRLAVQASISLHEPTPHAQLAAAPSDSTPPMPETPATWFQPSPEKVGTFSAVCWMFGRRLQAKLGVPLGLIQVRISIPVDIDVPTAL